MSLRLACRGLETLLWESPEAALCQLLQDFEVSSVPGIGVRATQRSSLAWRGLDPLLTVCCKGTQLYPAPLHFHLSTPGSRYRAKPNCGEQSTLSSPAPGRVQLWYRCACLTHG